ncbi:hypothetical protein HMN09_00564300 [Mycena chlorophos]|uniref:Uncharacterized protein n=1 Tax=Mycena chlorophos TaxID=658473 RepID=A0A8H6TAR3_MYCCL|nr:hypothetical protein HMN09_00564300 [Mycena chlorophos]
MSCQFSFGPQGSFFCSAGAHFTWSKQAALPAPLQRILNDPRHPLAMATPYDVAFPVSPSTASNSPFAMCWRTATGSLCSNAARLSASYGRLSRFFHSSTATHGVPTRQTVFGPDSAYFSSSERGYAWDSLPEALEDELQSELKVRRPKSIALGVDGSWVVVYSDGTLGFDLRGAYPRVEAILRDTEGIARRNGLLVRNLIYSVPKKTDLQYISLNPYIAGEFYLVFGDASARWKLPTAWTADVTEVSKHIRPLRPSSPTTPSRPAPSTPIHLTPTPTTIRDAQPGGDTPPAYVPSNTVYGAVLEKQRERLQHFASLPSIASTSGSSTDANASTSSPPRAIAPLRSLSYGSQAAASASTWSLSTSASSSSLSAPTTSSHSHSHWSADAQAHSPPAPATRLGRKPPRAAATDFDPMQLYAHPEAGDSSEFGFGSEDAGG